MGCDVDDPAVWSTGPTWPSTGLGGSATSTWRSRPWPTAGWPTLQAGRVAEGMAMIDEAMALACGGGPRTPAVAKSLCSFFTACYYTADFERVEVWSPVLRQRGFLAAAPGPRRSSGATATACRGRCCATWAGGARPRTC